MWNLCEIQQWLSINKVLLEQSHTHFFTCCLWLHSQDAGRAEWSSERPHSPQSLKYWRPGPSQQKRFAGPCSRHVLNELSWIQEGDMMDFSFNSCKIFVTWRFTVFLLFSELGGGGGRGDRRESWNPITKQAVIMSREEDGGGGWAATCYCHLNGQIIVYLIN